MYIYIYIYNIYVYMYVYIRSIYQKDTQFVIPVTTNPLKASW